MKQKKSYAKTVSDFLSNITEGGGCSRKHFRTMCLMEIAVMLGVIADILEGRNIELKDESLHGS